MEHLKHFKVYEKLTCPYMYIDVYTDTFIFIWPISVGAYSVTVIFVVKHLIS